jgi:hypothetical protein
MQNVFQVPGHVHKFAYIVVMELKLLQWEQMFDISQVTRNEIVHPDYMVTFFQESLAQMTSQEAGSACN